MSTEDDLFETIKYQRRGDDHDFWKNEDGELHRIGGPAIIYDSGVKNWYRNGKLHREDGPAMEYPGGRACWFLDGFLHRTDGPAIIQPGLYSRWYINDELHRDDGPAVEYPDGTGEWWTNGKFHPMISDLWNAGIYIRDYFRKMLDKVRPGRHNTDIE